MTTPKDWYNSRITETTKEINPSKKTYSAYQSAAYRIFSGRNSGYHYLLSRRDLGSDRRSMLHVSAFSDFDKTA